MGISQIEVAVSEDSQTMGCILVDWERTNVKSCF